MVSNTLLGKDEQSGWSLRNVGRAVVLGQGFDFFGEDANNQTRLAKLMSVYAPFGAQGDILTNAVASTGQSEIDIMRSGWAGQLLDKINPGFLESLAVSPAEQQANALSDFNRDVASKYQIKPERSLMS